MRTLGEADWFGYRVQVPLTGREPVLVRLRNRLKRRGGGWGWVTLQGPEGSGVTRMLEEASLLIQGEAGPEPIWIRPVPGVDLPMESLRRALAGLLVGMDAAAGARRLRAMLSTSHADVDTLACWLLAGARAAEVARPSVDAARQLLERLAPGGIVLADDFDLLDDETRRVLLPSAQHEGPGVIAGISGEATLAPDATIWPLDPLSGSQVELMLRRWLRNTATARRLTPEMVRRYGGWPGRIVEAVRCLGRDGQMLREPRGVVVQSLPKTWPDGARPRDAFVAWARALGTPAARLLDIVALQGEPIDTGLLADAAGVKSSFVEAVLAEAVATRDGRAPGRFIATAELRDTLLRDMPADQRQAHGIRLADAWRRRDPAADATACVALGRVVAYLLADRREEATAHISVALRLLRDAPITTDCDVRRLEALAKGFGTPRGDAERTALVELASALVTRGRGAVAKAVLATSEEGDDLRAVWVRARLDLAAGRVNQAHARLAAVLPLEVTDSGTVCFDALALHARLSMQLGDCEAARRSWCLAGRTLTPSDLARRATFHQGVAACAAHGGRRRAMAAHLRRAVRMFESLGNVSEAALVWARLGEAETLLGRYHHAVECLSRAAHQHSVVGAHDPEARARLLLGRTYLACSSYDQAAKQLGDALEVADRESLKVILPEIHLALATAHRGRGDLALERHHASEAVILPAPAAMTLRAKAILAEADLRAGAPGALRLLESAERDLRMAGLVAEADEARALLFDTRLRTRDMSAAEQLLRVNASAPRIRLGRARFDLVRGRDPEASVVLEALACDPSLSIDLRTVAYAHLAEALRRQGRLIEARAAAISASALLEVQHRSRRDDLRIHRILARVFQEVGDSGRAAGHRAAARRHLRTLLAGANDPREGLRLARAQWRLDPTRGIA